MRGNNVVGVLFSNVHDDKIRELTERRTIASNGRFTDIVRGNGLTLAIRN